MAEPSSTRRRALVVLGMHRSGTSAVAKLLSVAGAALPHHIMPSNSSNELGYWEPQRVADFNDQVLRSLDSGWDDTFGPRRRTGDSRYLSRFLDPACRLVREEYGEAELIVLKEPRINVLLELWQQALGKSGFHVHYVIMVRRPDEVARSLRLRDNISTRKSLLLWATYMINSERATRLSSRVFVQFDALIDDHAAVLDNMERAFGFTFPRRTLAAEAEAHAAIDLTFKHHNAIGPLRLPKGLKPIGALYDYLSVAAAGESRNDDIPNDVGAWLQSLDGAVGPLLAAMQRELTASRTRERISEQALKEKTSQLVASQDHAAELQSALAAARATEEAINQEKADLLVALDRAVARGDEAARVAQDEVRAAQAETASLTESLKLAEAGDRAARTELHRALQQGADLDRQVRETIAAANNRAELLAREARQEAARLESAIERALAEGVLAASRLADAERALGDSQRERDQLLDLVEVAQKGTAGALDQLGAARAQAVIEREESVALKASLELARHDAEKLERTTRDKLSHLRAEVDALRMARDAVSAQAAHLRAALKRTEGSLVWRMFGRLAGPAVKRAGASDS